MQKTNVTQVATKSLRSLAGSTSLTFGLMMSALMAPAVTAQSADDSAYAGPEEIVVTARKRAESMYDVPISINVVSSDLINKLGAQDFTDLLGSVPSLTAYQNGPGRTRLTIRGVANGGGNDNDTQNQETVGIYLDEIPISLGAMNPEIGLFDLERVEVLRGPQGTLYGAGSMAGTVRLVSKKPNLEEVEGLVELDASDLKYGDQSYGVKALINAPIINDVLGVRVSGYYTHNGGYLDNVTTGEKNLNDGSSKGVKVAARYQPSDNFTADLSFFHHEYSDNGRPEDLDSTPLFSRDYVSFDGYDDEMQIFNATFTVDLGWGELISSTSYFDRKVINPRSLDLLFELALPPGITPHELVDTTDLDVFTQELRLSSTTDSPFQWTVGAYTDKKDTYYLNTFPVPGADAIIGTPSSAFGAPDDHLFYGYDDLTVKTFAFFGEAYYSFDKFTVTAGLRYFNWKQDIEFYQSGLFNGGANSDPRPRGKTDGVNPKLNVSYDISDNALVYAQVARGFRYGGINGAIPEAVCADELAEVERQGGDVRFFNPDKTWNYEIGAKGRAADGKLSYNAAYFHVKWDDMQTSRSFECGFGFRENVGKATSQGVELELDAQLSENWSVGFGGTYLQSELDEDVPNLNAVSGDQAPYVPELSFNATVNYIRPITDTMDLFVWLNHQYVGTRHTEFNHDPDTNYRRMDDYSMTNARIGFEWEDMEVSLYANNLFDSQGVVRALRRPPFDPDAVIRVQPRTIGVTFRKHF
ncbi:TonB-dependent receptor [Kordiimonas sediminis]|uniref:TonB-dependent receptor n=1 Tax=Kordiimonas sediminis TaxID=1735581 RepID=A0A919AUH0_9PROT|nr:TonB-dependent receptor [Kordiimonas sediminis]GHF25861.1 TonB-dependent receptor [Kordiimonas sediminis]